MGGSEEVENGVVCGTIKDLCDMRKYRDRRRTRYGDVIDENGKDELRRGFLGIPCQSV